MAMQSLLRVHREIRDVNENFHSLRTVLKETENKLKWNFVMFPNDGALSHLPLIGELIIPVGYPNNPPVLHLFTRTLRWNVDIYHYALNNDRQSTMCFDILRSESEGGIWKPDYTVSCLFASLMQALVTPRVPQSYGPDRAEFVSMEHLKGIKMHVHKAYSAHKDRIPHLPLIPTIPAVSTPAEPLNFHRITDDAKTPLQELQFQGSDTYLSQPIYLQDAQNTKAWSVLLDLRNLHPGVVFSVILSNKPGTDLVGRRNNTILLRNGVTGTAAKKRASQPIEWFYHGKPLNDRNLSVCVTVNSDQFTIAYKSDDTSRFLVHGDTPISKLGRAQIGDVAGIPFYVTIFLKRKTGNDGFINVLDQNETGFIHANSSMAPQDPYVSSPSSTSLTLGREHMVPRDPDVNAPTSVRLALGREQTSRLQGIIDFYGLGWNFKIQNTLLDPAYQTLVSSRDMPPGQYSQAVKHIYVPFQGKLIEVNVIAIIADGDCVALLTDTPRCSEIGLGIPLIPKDRMPHIRMRLRDESIMADYSNTLARRVTEDHERDWIHVGDTYIRLPQPVKILCHLEFEP